jgi:hypothetical protein
VRPDTFLHDLMQLVNTKRTVPERDWKELEAHFHLPLHFREAISITATKIIVVSGFAVKKKHTKNSGKALILVHYQCTLYKELR